MSKWSKKTFIDHLNQSCESDVAMHCIELVDFSEKTSDEVSWGNGEDFGTCLLYTSPSPRDGLLSRMPSSA